MHPMELTFPEVCCGCGTEPTQALHGRVGGTMRFTVPVCAKCAAGITSRRQAATLAVLVVTAVTFAVMIGMQPNAPLAGALMGGAMFGAMAALFAHFGWIQFACLPLRFRKFNRGRDYAEMQFVNARVGEMYQAWLQGKDVHVGRAHSS